jgi:hypothetical protein
VVNINFSCWLLGVALPINLIFPFLLLEFSGFLHFVEVNVELLSVKAKVVKTILGVDSGIRSLEASKSVETLTFLWEDLDAFNNSELLKQSFKFYSCCLRREVLDVKIASLL